MKNIKKLLILLPFVWTMTGCEKDFLDINTSPNLPTASTPELVLPAALSFTAVSVNNNLNILGNLLSGNWAQAPDFLFYNPQETFQFTASTYQTTWNSIYADGLMDYKYVEQQASQTNKPNLVAISKIMQAYNFQLLVDTWGDVPFSQALKGSGNISPAYDKAEDIYDGLLTLINDGLASINTTAVGDKPGASDVVFKGDMAKWAKFGNTLKLRILLRQSLISSRAAKVTAGFATLTTATFLGAGETAGVNPGYSNGLNKTSPLFGAIGFSVSNAETSNYSATRGNKFALDFLNSNADPRVSLLYRPAAIGGAYVGVFPGTAASNTTKNGNYSAVGPGILPFVADNGFAKPAYLISAAESYFLQAEAMLKGYLPGGAAGAGTAYNKGIEESFKLLGSTATAADAFFAGSTSPLVNWTAATAANRQFEAIITQKWVAQNGINGSEAWAEFRRTGFPTGVPISINNISGGKYPLRIPYVQTELAGNASNVPAINIFTDKIFWEK